MKSRDAIAPATITVAVTGISSGVTSSPTLMSRQSRVVVRNLSRGRHRSPSAVCGAEAGQLRGRRTQRQLVVLGPQEVTEQGIGGVDADAAVHLLGGRRDPRARLGRPELRDARPPGPAAPPCSSSHAACHMVHRIASTSMKASAIRCCTAWKLPIGLPNCSRSVVYAAAMRSARSVTPSWIAHSPTSARA